MTSRGLFLVVTLAACGGPSAPATTPAELDEPDRCAAAPEVAATRVARTSTGCLNADDLAALESACEAGDPVACDRAVGCRLSFDLDPAPGAVASMRVALRTACDGGIAESCRLRVGVVTETGGAMPADACDDLIRGCQLGDESSCFDCGNHCR